MFAYVVEQLDTVKTTADPLVNDMDLMSPFVWKEADTYHMLVRAVPRLSGPATPTGIIYAASSLDGITFAIEPGLAIGPGVDAVDAGGCEDPTVLLQASGRYLVYYTGVDAPHLQGAMILASGRDLSALVKQRLVLKAPPGEGNIKEATLAQIGSDDWRLFYEYAANDASRIGMASGPTAEGPWTTLSDPFGIREDSWDNWHLSTGPIIQIVGHDPVMFYNGATHDARWRIGWISFDPGFTRVTGRGLQPLLLPPPAKDRAGTDIAFAASTVIEGERIALYYSLEDRMLRRALVARYER